MEIEIRKSFSRDTKKCPLAVKQAIAKAIGEMMAAKSLTELYGLKALKGGKDTRNAYRMRIADYRICFYSQGNVIELIRVLPRKIVYRYFP